MSHLVVTRNRQPAQAATRSAADTGSPQLVIARAPPSATSCADRCSELLTNSAAPEATGR